MGLARIRAGPGRILTRPSLKGPSSAFGLLGPSSADGRPASGPGPTAARPGGGPVRSYRTGFCWGSCSAELRPKVRESAPAGLLRKSGGRRRLDLKAWTKYRPRPRSPLLGPPEAPLFSPVGARWPIPGPGGLAGGLGPSKVAPPGPSWALPWARLFRASRRELGLFSKFLYV